MASVACHCPRRFASRPPLNLDVEAVQKVPGASSFPSSERYFSEVSSTENNNVARYRLVDRSPRFLPIVLESQLIPGSFEHALDVLVDTEIDLSPLAARFRNDETARRPTIPR